MAQTLVAIYYHIIFSTKNRAELITPVVEDELYAYIGGILNKNRSKLLIGNGTQNHAHLLTSLDKKVLLPQLIGDVKRSSSRWLKTKGGMLVKFGWQDGYSAFTVGHTQLEIVKRYVAGQKEHHQKKYFEDEMRELYDEHGVSPDERCVWD